MNFNTFYAENVFVPTVEYNSYKIFNDPTPADAIKRCINVCLFLEILVFFYYDGSE